MSEELLRTILAARTPAALSELKPYVPDPTKVPIRLDANEAPALLPTLDDSERALLAEALMSVEPARYPDVRANVLRAAIADKIGVSGDQLVLGVGSDEVIAILLATLAKGAPKILVPTPTFVMYRVSARVHGYEVVEVPLDRDWDLDTERMVSAIKTHEPAVTFLATPNNPTSGVYSLDRIEAIVEASTNGIVVVDEAYLAFRGASPVTGLDLLRRHANVVVMRTLSKIGLAAVRVGWVVAHPLLAGEMEKVRLPYDLPSYSQAVASCALGPLQKAIDRHVASILAERSRLLAELGKISRVSFGRTDANFVWLGLEGASAQDVVIALKNKGIMVRGFPAHRDRIRVTVGTRADDDRFLEALREVL
ncbi:MAG: histidinol-phosphate transaminase [Polyangiales bacterium]